MTNFILNKVLKECEDWVTYQLKHKDERLFVGEKSEIKESTLWKWRYTLQAARARLKDEEKETPPQWWSSLWNFYKYTVSSWPIGRIKSRAYAKRKQQEASHEKVT